MDIMKMSRTELIDIWNFYKPLKITHKTRVFVRELQPIIKEMDITEYLKYKKEKKKADKIRYIEITKGKIR
jgi:hypothetical protein